MGLKGEAKSRIQELRKEIEKGYKESAEKYPRLHRLIPFVAKLFIAGVVFRAIIFLNPDTYFLQEYLAEITIDILNLLGGNYSLRDALILGEHGSYLVTRDCLGWKSVSAFIGLIFASTKNLLDHSRTLVAGTVLLLAANLIRVVSTVWLSEAGIISFEIIHTFLWRWGMTALVLIVWYIWLKTQSNPEI
jgi:exosortase/archaeosortase family protein